MAFWAKDVGYIIFNEIRFGCRIASLISHDFAAMIVNGRSCNGSFLLNHLNQDTDQFLMKWRLWALAFYRAVILNTFIVSHSHFSGENCNQQRNGTEWQVHKIWKSWMIFALVVNKQIADVTFHTPLKTQKFISDKVPASAPQDKTFSRSCGNLKCFFYYTWWQSWFQKDGMYHISTFESAPPPIKKRYLL